MSGGAGYTLVESVVVVGHNVRSGAFGATVAAAAATAAARAPSDRLLHEELREDRGDDDQLLVMRQNGRLQSGRTAKPD